MALPQEYRGTHILNSNETNHKGNQKGEIKKRTAYNAYLSFSKSKKGKRKDLETGRSRWDLSMGVSYVGSRGDKMPDSDYPACQAIRGMRSLLKPTEKRKNQKLRGVEI